VEMPVVRSHSGAILPTWCTCHSILGRIFAILVGVEDCTERNYTEEQICSDSQSAGRHPQAWRITSKLVWECQHATCLKPTEQGNAPLSFWPQWDSGQYGYRCLGLIGIKQFISWPQTTNSNLTMCW
jgi:hypothetical protein